MGNYPQAIATTDHIEPAPRRVRGVINGHAVFDTTNALYVWEWPPYPQYYIPLGDIHAEFLVDEHHEQHLKRGIARQLGLQVGEVSRPGSVRHFQRDAAPELIDTVRFDWDVLDAWYEEDEQIYVHPRNPYARVDALRSTRPIRVELDGVLLAEAPDSIALFETGLPTRYYLEHSAVNFAHLEPSPTQSSCPYKGTTSGYWSVRVGDTVHPDLAWSYAFPAREVLPIAGLIAFYNEKVDITLDGELLSRPETHFS